MENTEAITIKLPSFWTENPTLWFSHIEAQFQISRITNDDTKFSYTVSSLPERLALEVQDILASPPTANKYVVLKEALINRISQSEAKRLNQLLQTEELGDRKPSQLLRRLRSLASNSISEDILKNLWISRLPVESQRILTVSQGDLESLATIADNLAELFPSSSNIAAISNNQHQAINDLTKQVSVLTTQIAELLADKNQRFRQRSRSNSRHRRPNNSTSRITNANVTQGYCWYHSNFGHNAKRCSKPCNFSNKENKTESL